jgi:ferredoxin
MCGAKAMYDFVRDELKNIGLEDVPIREEKNTIVDLDVKELKTYDLTVRMKNDIYKIKARNNETLLVAMERAGLAAPNRCRIGKCGFCHSRLINGEIYVREEDEFRRGADFKFNYIHPCCSYPKSDIEIEVPVVEELKEV